MKHTNKHKHKCQSFRNEPAHDDAQHKSERRLHALHSTQAQLTHSDSNHALRMLASLSSKRAFTALMAASMRLACKVIEHFGLQRSHFTPSEQKLTLLYRQSSLTNKLPDSKGAQMPPPPPPKRNPGHHSTATTSGPQKMWS